MEEEKRQAASPKLCCTDIYIYIYIYIYICIYIYIYNGPYILEYFRYVCILQKYTYICICIHLFKGFYFIMFI